MVLDWTKNRSVVAGKNTTEEDSTSGGDAQFRMLHASRSTGYNQLVVLFINCNVETKMLPYSIKLICVCVF